MVPGISDTARSQAPGKVILFGEHAVVYGRTALAASIDRYVEVAVTPAPGGCLQHPEPGHAVPAAALTRAAEITGVDPAAVQAMVSGNLPVGVGLGSSAAVSVGLVRALAKFARQALTDAAVCARAFEIEKIFHGFPSGIDNTVVTYGGLIAFRHGADVRPLRAASPIPLVIAVGRAPRETQTAVRALRGRLESSPGLYEPLFDDIDCLASEAEHAIGSGDLPRLGALMNANHRLLQRLGVSTEELDHLVAQGCEFGACGAKLTGGGGGGAVMCLCDGDREQMVARFTGAGWCAFATDIVPPRMEGADDAGRFEHRHLASA